MALVVAFVPDLLFGSNVVGAVRVAGHDPVLVSDLRSVEPSAVDLLVIDLTDDAVNRIAAVQEAQLGETRTLAFYSHVETDVRSLAVQAGFESVVPRSRMAREGAALIKRLLAPDQ